MQYDLLRALRSVDSTEVRVDIIRYWGTKISTYAMAQAFGIKEEEMLEVLEMNSLVRRKEFGEDEEWEEGDEWELTEDAEEYGGEYWDDDFYWDGGVIDLIDDD